MYDQPISNGKLQAMAPEKRHEVIAQLSPTVRRKLVHLATLGAELDTEKALIFLEEGHPAWVREKIQHANALSALAAELSAD